MHGQRRVSYRQCKLQEDSMTDQPNTEPALEIKDRLSVTQHEAIIGGRRVPYTATAGLVVLRQEVQGKGDEEGRFKGHQPKAEVFVTAYTRDGVDDPASRPITFAFNGGPGSSSVWLHLGVLGPRRVQLADDGTALPPPYRLIDNDHSLLDVSDLVFIDPVSTGFSRAVTGEKAGEFHGYQADLESVGEVIRHWLGRSGRWLSPKYLAGESYGTTRAAGLAGYLQQRHGIYLSGLMLLSSVLEFSTVRFGAGNDLPPLLYLPSYAATAWYHGRLDDELQQQPLQELLAQVESFALDHYAPALLRGRRLSPAEREEIVAQLARFTGLSASFIEQNNLRIDIHRFCKELLRSERKTVGRLDSRFVGRDRDAGGENFEFDPSYGMIQGPYTAALNDYVRRELEFESDLPYEILANLYQTWNYQEFQNRYVNVSDTLRQALSMNPALRVHVASGYFDLATPYFASEYTLDHLMLEPELYENISTSYYEAGHMMYVQLESLVKLKRELAQFMQPARAAS
jgi:carboxypeptidase C (cathepsin A)